LPLQSQHDHNEVQVAELTAAPGAATLIRPRVVYWNNIPTPYMVERFNAVAERGSMEFEAWFTRRGSADRSWELPESAWRFRYRFLPAMRLFGRSLAIPTPCLASSKPDLLVMLYSDLPSVAGWTIARLRGIRTAFWAQVTKERWARRRAWKEVLKRAMLRRVDATLGSGEESRRFTMGYGTAPARAHKLRHAIDGEFFLGGSDRARANGDRERLRRSLRLEGVVFVYVGRLWWGKGLNVLLDAFASIQRESAGEVSLLLLGDGPQEAALRRRCAELGVRNVVFAGFRQKPELPALYAASDVFVFPTLGDPYGLVVDEAMACGLPVISTDAAGEIRDRVQPGVNGHIVPVEDAPAMAAAMSELASDAPLRARMGAESRRLIEGSTPQRWARDFETVVNAILAQDGTSRRRATARSDVNGPAGTSGSKS
jgi:glycosyltransferase involved in cell wall biosynthesis